MEITDFLTTDFLASFTGTLIAVELIVFITKDFPLIKKIPTKIYTLILAIAHLSIEKVATGCVWNNRMTMLRWEDKQFFTQSAVKNYSDF